MQINNKLRDYYLSSAEAWNSTHRILGRNIEGLLSQSETAIRSWLDARNGDPCVVVDVGAGSGVGTVPLLWMTDGYRICFIEPDPKKAAFLLSLSANPEFKSRTKVLMSRVEFVSRETVGFQSGQGVLMVRAFSGDISLVDAATKSAFKNDIWFNFEAKNESFCFSPLKIK